VQRLQRIRSWLKRISGLGLLGSDPGFAAATPGLPTGEPTGEPGVGRGMELIPDCKAVRKDGVI
jgi:hypothetical protein